MSKVDDIRMKYSNINIRTFNNLNFADNTPTKKYLDYMCYLKTKNVPTKDIKDLVGRFDTLLPYIENKDVYSKYYTDVNNLRVAIEEADRVKFEKTFDKKKHITEVYKNEDLLVLHIKTAEGSKKYGTGTKWCISGNRNNLFGSYNIKSYIFFILYKKRKFAFLLDKSDPLFCHCSFFNDRDTNISPKTLSGNLSCTEGEIFSIISITRQYANDLTNKAKVIDLIKSFNGKLTDLIKTCDVDFSGVKSVLTTLTDLEHQELIKNMSTNIISLKNKFEELEKEMGG